MPSPVPSSPVSLLCLPCAGASATMYLRWKRLLPAWLQLVPVELPGRGARLGEPFAEDFDPLVAQLCAEQAAVLRGPCVLLGHSMGALLAFALARRLRAQGDPLPLALVASGSPAPSRRDPERFAGKDHDDALIADLRQQGGTPEAVFLHPELLRLTLDTLGADYRVCQSFHYRREAPLPLPLHIWAGRDDDIAVPRVQAWAEEAGAGCRLHWFDGGHFFIRQHESAVLSALVQGLGEVLWSGPLSPRDGEARGRGPHDVRHAWV